MKKRNANIETIRGIASILVVFVHFRINHYLGDYLISIARFAVPFFILVSGYFSYKETRVDNIIYAKKKLLATTRLALIGIVLCVISNSLLSIYKGDSFIKWFLDVVNIKTLVLFLVFNRAYWLSSVMYYLFMLIYLYIIYIILNKLNIIHIMYYTIPILLITNVIICKTMDNWYYAGNFLLTGIPFFGLGNYIRYKQKSYKWEGLVTAIIVGIVLSLVECYFSRSCYVYLGTILLSVGIFLLGINSEKMYFPNGLASFGTNYSTMIFLLHCSIGSIIQYLMDIHGIDYGDCLPFIVIVITALFSTIVIVIKKSLEHQRDLGPNPE